MALRSRKQYGIRRRRGWGKALSATIWERDEGHCVYCGDFGRDIDHVIPVSLGGPTVKSNGVLSCKRCNMKKFNRLPYDMLYTALRHLLIKGEDIDWLDMLWAEANPEKAAQQRKVFHEETVPYKVRPEAEPSEIDKRAQDAAGKAWDIITRFRERVAEAARKAREIIEA